MLSRLQRNRLNHQRRLYSKYLDEEENGAKTLLENVSEKNVSTLVNDFINVVTVMKKNNLLRSNISFYGYYII